MPFASPLESQALRDISDHLDAGNTDQAAESLAAVAMGDSNLLAIDYLTIRILFQRGRLDPEAARTRLDELLASASDFPEAKAWRAQLLTPNNASDSVPPSGTETPRTGAADASSEVEEEDLTPPDGNFLPPSSSPPSPAGRPLSSPAPRSLTPAPFDGLRAKERLPERAGRYRDGVHESSPSPRHTWEQRIDDALDLDERGSSASAPTQRLLHVLTEQSPALAPPYLARLARLHLLCGSAATAETIARQAWAASSENRETRWTLALVLVRRSRIGNLDGELREAGSLLHNLPRGRLTDPGLVEALSACIEVRTGSPSVALQLAQRALRLKYDSVDGLAALAEASAALGNPTRADAALEELRPLLDPAEMTGLKRRLRDLGAGDQSPASTASRWHYCENAVSGGAREAALEALSDLADSHREQLADAPEMSGSERGRIAAEFLRTGPVFRVFGDYRFTVGSVESLDASLSLLFGDEPQSIETAGHEALLLRISDYLGETLRVCLSGSWINSGNPPDDRIEVPIGQVDPLVLVQGRVAHGSRAPLTSALNGDLKQALDACQDAAPRRPLEEADIRPFPHDTTESDTTPWPLVHELPGLGRSLTESVVAEYTKRNHKCSLDRSVASLRGLDAYLQLVCPSSSPPLSSSEWAQWLAITAGSYYGEVLCQGLGGQWVPNGADGPEHYEIALPRGIERPVQTVIDALQGHGPRLLARCAERLK